MFHFSANIDATFRKTVVAVGPIPPVAAKTKGEKQAFSTSRIRSSYSQRFSRS